MNLRDLFRVGLHPDPQTRDGRLYTDRGAPADEWLENWTEDELEAWRERFSAAWWAQPHAPDRSIFAGAIPPVEAEFRIKGAQYAEPTEPRPEPSHKRNDGKKKDKKTKKKHAQR